MEPGGGCGTTGAPPGGENRWKETTLGLQDDVEAREASLGISEEPQPHTKVHVLGQSLGAARLR